MSAPKAVSIVGFKKAGKTQLVETLVRELTRRGHIVGTLKHGSEGHLLDVPGKDTWRHRDAGAVASAILTSKGGAIFLNRRLEISDAADILGPLDFIVVEGFKSLETVARIIVPKAAEDVDSLSNGLEIAISSPSEEALKGIRSKVPIIPLSRVGELADLVEEKAFPILTGFNCKSCGYEECRDLACAVVKGEAEAKRCVYLSESWIKLGVNGRDVPMHTFVQNFIANTVLGMVRSLKGIEEPRKIKLSIDLGGSSHERDS